MSGFDLKRVGLARSAHGSVVVEIALLTPVLLLMLIAAVDFGSFIYQKMQLQSAARAGAQFAIQSDATITDTTGIENAVRTASELDFGGVTITTTEFCGCSDGSESAPDTTTGCSGTCTGGEFPGLFVRVVVTGDFTPLFPYPGIPNPVSLEAETSLRVP